jgi:hypothetical protein
MICKLENTGIYYMCFLDIQGAEYIEVAKVFELWITLLW